MSGHSHDFPHWPFPGPVTQACFLCEHVHSGAMPVLTVSHDHDGDWQFLCGGIHTGGRPLLVCLGCAVERGQAPAELADLPRGWAADRATVDAPWIREALPPDDDDASGDLG